jgi:hypothetical protein
MSGLDYNLFAAREAAFDVVDGARSRRRRAIEWSLQPNHTRGEKAGLATLKEGQTVEYEEVSNRG